MITASEFLNKVKDISERGLTYRTGGSGSDGTCDCIGLIMGAMTELGHKKYDMHSSNYFARYQMDSLIQVEFGDIAAGYIVYKARANTQQLNERYQPGGRYYTGDMLDYYHVGVVESTDPLVIVHCTESGDVNGITRDFRLGSWSHAGRLKDVSYEKAGEVAPVEVHEAIVTANSGKSVNLRSRPSMGGLLYMRVPIGAKVTVYETAKNDAGESWSQIEFNGTRGYMMTQYLQDAVSNVKPSQEPPSVGEDEVRLILPKSVAEALLRALQEVPS